METWCHKYIFCICSFCVHTVYLTTQTKTRNVSQANIHIWTHNAALERNVKTKFCQALLDAENIS